MRREGTRPRERIVPRPIRREWLAADRNGRERKCALYDVCRRRALRTRLRKRRRFRYIWIHGTVCDLLIRLVPLGQKWLVARQSHSVTVRIGKSDCNVELVGTTLERASCVVYDDGDIVQRVRFAVQRTSVCKFSGDIRLAISRWIGCSSNVIGFSQSPIVECTHERQSIRSFPRTLQSALHAA